MNLLLDTSTFLWIILGTPDLSDHARELFTDPTNEVYLSAVSTWEISIKHGFGKLPLPDTPERFIPAQRERHGIAPLPLHEEATLYLHRLPAYHRDPFDRMLICQAIVHGMTILTTDNLILQYPVRSTW